MHSSSFKSSCYVFLEDFGAVRVVDLGAAGSGACGKYVAMSSFAMIGRERGKR